MSNDVTSVCICYIVLILHLYFLSYHFIAWFKAFFYFVICLTLTKNKNTAISRIAISVFFEQSFVTKVINVCVFLISIEIVSNKQKTVNQNWSYSL